MAWTRREQSSSARATEVARTPLMRRAQAITSTFAAHPRRRSFFLWLIVILVHGAVLAVAFRSVLFHGHTLMAGAYMPGSEGFLATWQYPIVPPGSRSVVAGNLFPLNGRSNIYDPGGSAWLVEPMAKKAHDLVAQGRLPVWTANAGLGQPLIAGAQYGLLDPVNWPSLIAPGPVSWSLFFLGRLLAGGLMMTVFLRQLGTHLGAATVGGLVFMMSGQLITHNNNSEVSVEIMVPAILLGIELSMRRPGRLATTILAGSVGFLLLAGFAEEQALCLTLCATYALARLAVVLGRPPVWSRLSGPCASLGGGLALGLLFGAPLLVPFLELLHVGDTFHGAGAHLAAVGLYAPSDLPGIVAPHWSGVLVPQWIGVVATVLAVLGLRSTLLPRAVGIALTACAAVYCAVQFDVLPPLVRLVDWLPVYRQVFWFRYSGIALSAVAAILAAAGYHRILNCPRTIRTWEVIAATVVPLGACVGWSVNWRTVSANPGHQRVVVGTLTLVAVVGTALMLTRSSSRHRIRHGAGLLCGLALAVELAWIGSPQVPYPASGSNPLQVTPSTAYLASIAPSGHGRVLGFDDILYPNVTDAYGFDSVHIIDAVFPERFYRYMHLFVDPTMVDRNVLGEGDRPPVRVWDNPYLDALSVDRLLTHGGYRPDNRTDGPAMPSDYPRETITADGINIYANTRAVPRAALFYDVMVSSSESETVTLMGATGFDPRHTVVVEGARSQRRESPPDGALISSYDDTHAVIEADARQDGVLVLSDVYFPGWTATVDGRSTAIAPANLALRGIPVTAGHHRIEMRYAPVSLRVGLGLAAVGTAILIGWWSLPTLLGALPRRSRRRTT